MAAPKLNRRDFIRGILAASTIAAVPGALAKEIERTYGSRVIRGKVFVLSAPMIIETDGQDLLIDDCIFIAAPAYEGILLDIRGAGNVIMQHCTIQTRTSVQTRTSESRITFSNFRPLLSNV